MREPALLSGNEEILPGITVRHFWAWALGDLRLNANRGLLAQFLVARALGDARERDDGWGNFDVETPEGIWVEVKASGYLQSWKQKGLSTISFSGLKARSWEAETGYSPHPEFRSDVYVFAVHTCQDPSIYDPLEVNAWDFYVLPAGTVRRLDQRSIRLSRLHTLAPPPTKWPGLRQAVLDAARNDDY